MREGRRGGRESSRNIDHLEIEVCKVNEPMSLVAVEILWLVEVCQVFMVSENLDWERGALEVVAPGSETSNDCKEFVIVDIVLSFSGGEQPGEVGVGVSVPISIGLQEDTSRGMFGGISGNGKGVGKVGETEDWLGKEELLEMLKGGLTSRGPRPGTILLGEVKERAGNIGKVGGKSLVEVGKAHKGVDILELLEGGPQVNAIKFHWVHGKFIRVDNHSEVLYFRSVTVQIDPYPFPPHVTPHTTL